MHDRYHLESDTQFGLVVTEDRLLIPWAEYAPIEPFMPSSSKWDDIIEAWEAENEFQRFIADR